MQSWRLRSYSKWISNVKMEHHYFILLILFVILLKRWDLMGSLDTKAQGCSSALEHLQNAALNVKQFGCPESFQSKKRGGWKVTFESLQCWRNVNSTLHASIFNIIQCVRFVFARREELAQKGDATAKMEVWFQRRGQVRSLLDDDDDDDDSYMGLDDSLMIHWRLTD